MVRQYPHFLFELKGGESVQDSSGEWTETEAVPVFLSVCREETDGRSTEVYADGTFHRFTSLIQLPAGAPEVAVGAAVICCDDAEGKAVRIRGVCQKFDAGQLHSRLWV